AVGPESNRLLSSRDSLVMPALKGPCVTFNHMGFATTRVALESTSGTLVRRLIRDSPLLDPPEPGLVGQRKPQHIHRWCKRRIDSESTLEFVLCLHMCMSCEIEVVVSTF